MTVVFTSVNPTVSSSLTVSNSYLFSAGTTPAAMTIGNWLNTTASSTTAWHPIYVDQFQNPVARIGPNGVATYARQAPPREFNRYVNASDLMEEFIAWVGTQGVRQREVMGLPIEAFIKWLIIRACEEDQEKPNVVLALPPRRAQPRCLGCGRFIPRTVALAVCRARCAERHFNRLSRGA